MYFESSWAARLGALGPLSPEDETCLSDMTCRQRARKLGVDFAESRDAPNRVLVMITGLACRSRLLPDGRRQILSYLFPGDMTSPDCLLARSRGPLVSMLIPSEAALLDRAELNELRSHQNIDAALGRYALVRDAVAAEWQVNVGLRTAQERIAHLICEMYSRLESVGHAKSHVFRLSLTQAQLADTVALSAVHVNRVLMDLRRQKVIAIGDGIVAILDYGRLQAIAGFDPHYLCLDEEWKPEPTRQGGNLEAAR